MVRATGGCTPSFELRTAAMFPRSESHNPYTGNAEAPRSSILRRGHSEGRGPNERRMDGPSSQSWIFEYIAAVTRKMSNILTATENPGTQGGRAALG